MSELCQDTTIILYFTDDMCTPCINFSVSKLIEWFPNYRENRNVILLTRGIEDKFRDSFYGKPVCCLKNEEQNMLQSEVPLFFLIYPDLTIHFVFVPYENAPEFTDSYLRTIRSRFFNTINCQESLSPYFYFNAQSINNKSFDWFGR